MERVFLFFRVSFAILRLCCSLWKIFSLAFGVNPVPHTHTHIRCQISRTLSLHGIGFLMLKERQKVVNKHKNSLGQQKPYPSISMKTSKVCADWRQIMIIRQVCVPSRRRQKFERQTIIQNYFFKNVSYKNKKNRQRPIRASDRFISKRVRITTPDRNASGDRSKIGRLPTRACGGWWEKNQ